MRVTIEHREASKGLVFRKAVSQVHATVQFSAEELQTIKSRKLNDAIVMERGVPADQNPNSFQGREDTWFLTIDMLRRGTDVYTLANPMEARHYEEELKKRLVILKDFLQGNSQVAEGSTTFEL